MFDVPGTRLTEMTDMIDTLTTELEAARVEASDLAGQLTDCRAQVAAEQADHGECEAHLAEMQAAHAERCEKVKELQAECDALHAKIDAMRQSYQQERSTWPEGYTHEAWAKIVRGEWDRAAAAEASATALRGLLAEVAEHLPVVTPDQRARLARITAALLAAPAEVRRE
jgi:chromosome segregation ATPase